ncbi:hypothetical protein [Ruegeria sp. A3M17]|uniref:hypothetical protein n=1 Tax=Ruegeria sp. A3M17 TaxID=2267229 RepID=UPI000DE80AD9|nr:hypothetical protein [Ruegeria sp. A3M17]RBW58870.1 hypothetical protein DS906_08820 [Ruegeria sp. A3M17]
MTAGDSGRISISWTQTELNGLEAAPQSFLKIGAAWSWRGQALSLASPAEQGLVLSGQAEAYSSKLQNSMAPSPNLADGALGRIVLTNGARKYTALLFSVAGEANPTLVFENGYPARDQEFWVSAYTEFESESNSSLADQTVVAFPTRSPMDKSWENAVAGVRSIAD